MFTLQEALEAIKNKPEFRCNEREYGYVIDYAVAFTESFKGSTPRETLILQNLRGTCFDHSGKIIRLAYHKFHNLNENAEYAEENFPLGVPHVVQEKLDGSMITPIPMPDGSWKFGTRAGVTEVADKAMALLKSWEVGSYQKYAAYVKLIESMLAVNHTVIFEFCSREQRIVIDYPEPFLAVTGVRCNETGEYKSNRTLRWFVQNPRIIVARTISDHHGLGDLAKKVSGLLGEEGVVVKFDDGRFVKIKATDYCLKHRALDGLRNEKDVLQLVLKNELDDVLPLVTPEVRDRLVAYNESVWYRLNLAQQEMVGCFDRLKHLTSKKEFAEMVKDSVYKQGLFKMYDGKNYQLKDFVLTKCGSSTDVESVRWLIGKSYLEF
jgi:RNA ligase